MMDYLFSMLLVPFFPSLDDPRTNHASTIAVIQQRLSAGQEPEKRDLNPGRDNSGSEFSALSKGSTELPPITGRLFQWSSTQSGDESRRLAALDSLAESLRLTGLIESSGQQVAILSDGKVDHVVGLGSYVLGVYKVTSFGPGRIVLSGIGTSARTKSLELNLIPLNTLGDAQ